jgi:uncharacterized protein YqhQ
MILNIYQAICICFAGIMIWNLFRSRDLQEKIVYAFILMPLVLRAMLFK